MRVLVAGGAGFLGSHLCSRLVAEGHSVSVLDDLSTGKLVNIAPLIDSGRLQFTHGDVVDPFEGEFDLILNFACPASPPSYQKEPIRTLLTSVQGAHNLLGLAARCNATYVQASTSEIYGDAEQHPQTESYWGNVNPIGIRACYDEGKRVAETLCFDHARTYGTKVKVVRIFNTYGPNMQPDDGRVVSNFINQAIRNQDLTIYGTGEQTRSFCYVDDLVDGILRLAHTAPSVTGPVNLGNPSEFTMLALAEKILRLTSSSSRIRFLPLPADDPRQRRPDIGLAWSLLGWQPRVGVDDGLERTIGYFREVAGRAGRDQ